MSLRNLEIGSWKVHKFWTEEIPAYGQEIARFGGDIKRGDFKAATHSFTNLLVEWPRIFAYTIGHIWLVALLVWAALNIYRRLT